jgi:HSP20 family protein
MSKDVTSEVLLNVLKNEANRYGNNERWLSPTFDLMTGAQPMDRLFERFFGYRPRTQEGGAPTHALPVDLVETEDSYLLYATIAGVPEDGVEVTFENGMLCMAVQAAPFEVQGRVIRQERLSGNWSRKLELPKEVDSTNITADFSRGVLTVRMPKAAKAKPLQIAIGASHKSAGASQEPAQRKRGPRG